MRLSDFVKRVQRTLGVDPDGRPGAKTLAAWERLHPSEKSAFGLESEMWDRFGAPGPRSLSYVDCPYPLKLSWDTATPPISRFSAHRKVVASLESILTEALDHYGIAEIRRLKLDLWGGCYNHRKKRGGDSMSTHAWGVAVDLNPDENQLRWTSRQAAFARPEYNAFFDIVYANGWWSLGREKDFDWMHIQAPKPD